MAAVLSAGLSHEIEQFQRQDELHCINLTDQTELQVLIPRRGVLVGGQENGLCPAIGGIAAITWMEQEEGILAATPEGELAP